MEVALVLSFAWGNRCWLEADAACFDNGNDPSLVCPLGLAIGGHRCGSEAGPWAWQLSVYLVSLPLVALQGVFISVMGSRLSLSQSPALQTLQTSILRDDPNAANAGQKSKMTLGQMALAGIVISSGPGDHFETYEGYYNNNL